MPTFPWRPGETSFLTIDGARLEAACFGPAPGAAPTLVLLHEGLGCVALWRDWPQKLTKATGLGVFAYSRRGYGRSSPIALPRPLDYMTREATETLPRVLEAVGAEQIILLGHSDGATIAAIYAGAGDDQPLCGLALIAPHFFAEPEGLQAIRAAERDFAAGLRARLAKYHDDVGGAFYGWSRAWLDPAFARWNVADCVDRWRVPALVVQGDNDPYGTLKQVEAAQPRATTLILPGVGHAPQFEQPAATLAAIADFCSAALAAPRRKTCEPGSLDSAAAISSIADGTLNARGQT